MTVYWLDPYIDTDKGGIHGTTDTTTRDGSYAYPWGIAEFISNSSTALSSINGTTISSGDEIRIKGQALVNYLYDVGPASRLVDVVLTETYNEFDIDSTYLSGLNNYRSLVNSWNSSTKLVYVYIDPGRYNSNNNPFYLMASNYNETSGTDVGIQSYTSYYAPNLAFGMAKYNTTENYIAGRGDQVGFVHTDYFIDIYSLFTTANMYMFNLIQGITITDGWSSSSVRDGVTLLPFVYTNNSAITTLYFGCYNHNAVDNTTVFDLPNTHFLEVSSTTYRVYYYTYWYFRGYNGESTQFADIGGWYTERYSSKNVYLDNGSTSASATKPSVRFGNFMGGGSTGITISGTGNSSSEHTNTVIDNYISGRGAYLAGAFIDVTFGNVIIYMGYSDPYVIGSVYNSTNYNIITLNGFMYSFTSGSIPTMSSDITTYGNDFSVPGSANPEYPAIYYGTTYGPSVANLKQLENYYTRSSSNVTLTKTSITEIVAGAAYSQITNYSQFYVNNYGTLDCDGTNYQTTNYKLVLKHAAYTNTSYWGGPIHTFTNNNYDGKSIVALSPYSSTAFSNYLSHLIGYNNSGGDFVVQGTTNAPDDWYQSLFMVNTGDMSASSTLTISCEIEMTSDFTSNKPNVYVYLPYTNASTSIITLTRTSSGNIHSYTYDISLTNIDTDSTFVGVKVLFRNESGMDYNDKYYLRNLEATLS